MSLPALVGPDMFPPGPPSVSGENFIINLWLNQPARVERTLRDLSLERFVADYIYTPGPAASGGSVLYDQILGNGPLYAGRDVEPIEPGSEFPPLPFGDITPAVARTVKWGGAFLITDEEVRRDRRDQLARKLTALRNTIIRKVDTVALAVLRAAPIGAGSASASWATSTTNIFKDTATVKATVDKLDMGYEIDTALISPQTGLNMLTNDKLLNYLPREAQGAAPNPVLVGRLSGVAGITRWIQSNRVGDDEVIFLSGRQAGSISDERPLYSRVVPRPESESTLVMAARLMVPFVTDPKSVFRLTGVA